MTVHEKLETLFPKPVDPYERVQKLLDGVPDFAALHAAVELDVFEALAHEPLTGEQLAQVCGADPAAIGRLMGWLHAHGYVAAGAGGYELTGLGRVLTAEAEPSCRHAVLVTGSAYWRHAIGRLPDTIRRGHPQPPEGQPVYDHLALTLGLAEQFDRFMTARSTAVGRDLAALNGWADVQVVADLGGGLGGVLAALMHAHPHLRGILAERPAVTARAHAYLQGQGLLGRVSIVAADIFQQIPRGAQRYLLSSILHNYGHEQVVALLAGVRRAVEDTAENTAGSAVDNAVEDNAGVQVWIVEGMLPRRPGRPSPWYSTDVRMLALFHGGQVRRVSQISALAQRAGLEATDSVRLPCGQTLLRCRPVHAS